MIDRSFIEKIESMAQPSFFESGGRKYSSRQLHLMAPPLAAPLRVATLQAVVDYLSADPGRGDVIIHVVSPQQVNLVSPLRQEDRDRDVFLEASCPDTPFPFDTYVSVESFVIALQARFVQDDTTAALLKIAGNITHESKATIADDGVTQRVEVKSGITRVEGVTVPNPVTLRPYRTFVEVEQPASQFVFRVKRGSDGIFCALFEADGGAWKLEAIKNIRKWLEDNISGVDILA